ncbi:MAG: hypothetical protein KKE61_14940, partial [Proteobacteria bacterium]|nr:hypothetical protein [Pseudomonadota bacterium]
MTFTKSFYQKTGLIFFVWVALVFMPGVAGAIVETSKVICRVETDKRVLLAGDSQNVVLKITLDAPST